MASALDSKGLMSRFRQRICSDLASDKSYLIFLQDARKAVCDTSLSQVSSFNLCLTYNIELVSSTPSICQFYTSGSKYLNKNQKKFTGPCIGFGTKWSVKGQHNQKFVVCCYAVLLLIQRDCHQNFDGFLSKTILKL